MEFILTVEEDNIGLSLDPERKLLFWAGLRTAPRLRNQDMTTLEMAIINLARDDASYMTGQVQHPNGGEIVNG